MTEPKSSAKLASLPEGCQKSATFEAFYRGWDRAGMGKPCRPPPLLSDEMKRAYVGGYTARMSTSES